MPDKQGVGVLHGKPALTSIPWLHAPGKEDQESFYQDAMKQGPFS